MKFLKVFLVLLIYSCNHKSDNITIVDLSSRKLTSVPDSIFDYNNLVELQLGAEEVIFYPPLSRLREGDENRNRITKLPEKISEFKNLRVLILNSNDLMVLPKSFSQLENLEILDLSLNNNLKIIEELPKLKRLPKLKILKIVDTKCNKNDLEVIRNTLGTNIKLIYTIEDYSKSYDNKFSIQSF